MTNYPPPPPPNYPPPPAAKPKKPLYTRWWFWAGVIIVVAIVGAAIGGGSKKDSDNADGSDSPSTSTSQQAGGGVTSSTPKPKVSKGLGSSDASRDITLSKLIVKKESYGSTTYKVDVTIKNNSSKRSDYFVTVALESADGSQQLDTATVIAQNVEPGQSKQDSGTFLKPLTDDLKIPNDAKITLQEVQRTAST